MNQIYSYLIIILIAIIGLILGFSAQRQFIKSPTIPLPPEFLASPLIDTFYANVEGRVVTKTADSLTLQKDGNKLTMFIEEDTGLTSFSLSSKQGLQTLDFDDVRVGDYIKGGISIIATPSSAVGLSKPRKVGDVIAHRFTVERK